MEVRPVRGRYKSMHRFVTEQTDGTLVVGREKLAFSDSFCDKQGSVFRHGRSKDEIVFRRIARMKLRRRMRARI